MYRLLLPLKVNLVSVLQNDDLNDPFLSCDKSVHHKVKQRQSGKGAVQTME